MGDESFEDSSRSPRRRVCLVESPDLLRECDRLLPVANRATQVSSLIHSFDLVEKTGGEDHDGHNNSHDEDKRETPVNQCQMLVPRPLSPEDLKSFHSSDYVEFLQQLDRSSDPECLAEQKGEEFGLGYDCPALPNLLQLCLTLAGASVAAAESLTSGLADVAVNWCGGWHHAQRDQARATAAPALSLCSCNNGNVKAEGFCYVNDIALCIHTLRQKFGKVLYVDLDVHHGNGVENAFAFSPNVFTLSMHLLEPGFYPGTGNIDDVGCGKGKFYTLNVPLKENTNDDQYILLFNTALRAVLDAFEPSAVVVQCGADSLSADPIGKLNLSPVAYETCLSCLLNLRLPTVILGGGGYNNTAAAILWTRLTALALDLSLNSTEIPDSDTFFMSYSPEFDLTSLRTMNQVKNRTHVEDVSHKISLWELSRGNHFDQANK